MRRKDDRISLKQIVEECREIKSFIRTEVKWVPKFSDEPSES